MDDNHWGHCRSCKFFGSPARVPLGSEEAQCQQPELAKYRLTVYGSNGCTAWELRVGLPDQVEDRPRASV